MAILFDLKSKLKQMRAVKGLTLTQAQDKSGIKAQTISKYETGALGPSMDSIIKMCDAYGYKIMIVQKGVKIAQNDKMVAVRSTEAGDIIGIYDRVETFVKSVLDSGFTYKMDEDGVFYVYSNGSYWESFVFEEFKQNHLFRGL